ncbi:MAG: 2-polyprenyl-3-methyl-5-hydroxy-6-metoxy,4-benzoquinol methylase [Acidimicrobiales bacterium]|nr:2-polyprenyl-3-methyl-5-hydroxy-6-metoxy,4-benzoquinol methylase [Acidimicrobiales bacterium]
MPDDYRPAEYWDERLATDGLRATGHHSYRESYNRWLYRAKGRGLRWAMRDIARGTAALDVGSGNGWVVSQLLAMGMTVEACDIAPVAVERLGRRWPGLRIEQVALGADPLPWPDGRFGLVTALDVTYHVVDDALWLAGLAEMSRVLAPGGRLVVTDGFGPSDRAPQPHVRFRSAASWADAAAGAGFRVVGSKPLYQWLSRDRDSSRMGRLPDGVRGAVEYCLDRMSQPRPHLRITVLAAE